MPSSIRTFFFCIALIYSNSAINIECITKITPSPTLAPTTETPTTPEPTYSSGSATPQPTHHDPIIDVPNTAEPTTAEPTTAQPTIPQCYPDQLDTIILNDVTCSMTQAQCQFQQDQIWNILQYIKPEDDESRVYNAAGSRVAYIEFDGSDDPQIHIKLNDKINKIPVNASDIDTLESDIINSVNCSNAPLRTSSTPNLHKAITFALDKFKDSDEKLRQKKLIIFSNCKTDNVAEICADQDIQNEIRSADIGVAFYMVNIGDNFDSDDLYIMCLLGYDPDRHFMIEYDSGIHSDDLHSIRDELCGSLTAVPTMDPTTDPISARRMMDIESEYDITSGFDGSPCIEMNIKIETENLLPINSDPDPVSNIIVIAKAIADLTLGKVTIPEVYDADENDTVANSNVVWEIGDSCDDGVSQLNQTWMPSNKTTISLDFTVTEEADGFLAIADLQTEDSIMYVTQIDALAFSMSHDCDEGDLIVQGAIYTDAYDDSELVASTESVSISSDDGGSHTFAFDSTLELYPSTSYIVQFTLVNDYPSDCSFDDLVFGESSRRRLDSDSDEEEEITLATLKPDACVLGKSLAKSPAMQAGAEAMCSDNPTNLRSQIEEGLFRQHISQSAIHNHLFKTGSLHMFDASGIETFTTADFPSGGVKDPCIAVDEENNIIFSIGGHIDGEAVNQIQAYQFTDSNLTNGTALNVGEWQLDEKRYGSTCFFWKDSSDIRKIIVLSGMKTTDEEFKNRKDWYNDVRLFPVPDFIYDQEELTSSEDIFIPPSFPTEGNYELPDRIIDQRPLLYNEHKLYLFGGKTHKSSKEYVTLMDLNDIREDATNHTLLNVQAMLLGEDRALPLTDLVEYDGESCYMIFNGQQYLDKKRVNSTSSLVQMFCNPNINSNRRRLVDSEMPKFTAFDREMMQEAERRRLQDESEANSEVFITKYNYTLDGIWYNFSVNFELCYTDNTKLREAEAHYRAVEEGKPDDFAWLLFKEQTADEILNVSQEVYEGWSNGFGAVKVWDLEIIEVRYDDTPSPTEEGELSHPERRKARHWYDEECDEDDENFIWIDEQFDVGDSYDDDE